MSRAKVKHILNTEGEKEREREMERGTGSQSTTEFEKDQLYHWIKKRLYDLTKSKISEDGANSPRKQRRECKSGKENGNTKRVGEKQEIKGIYISMTLTSVRQLTIWPTHERSNLR